MADGVTDHCLPLSWLTWVLKVESSMTCWPQAERHAVIEALYMNSLPATAMPQFQLGDQDDCSSFRACSSVSLTVQAPMACKP